MRLNDYYSIIRRRWLLLLALPVLGALVAFGVSKLQTPTYKSSVQMRVDISRPDYGLGLTAEKQLRNLVYVVKRDEVYQKITERLQLDLPKDRLRDMVRYSERSDDLIIDVEVTDTDPNRAQAIAEQLGREFEERQLARNANIDPNNRINVEMIDPPRPGQLAGARASQNAIAGGILGLILAVLVAGALEFLEDTLRGSEDVQRVMGLPILGAIPVAGTGTARIGLPRRLAGATRLFSVLAILAMSTLMGIFVSLALAGRLV